MIYLITALLLAAAGQITVKKSAGFRRWIPSLLSFLLFGLCIYFLTVAVQYMEVGIAYAIWSGASIVSTTIIGILLFNETASRRKLFYIGLILIGVIIL
ncbi:SMR family transporter [Halobacillus salinarum]|uniref:SMR family transporter n=1 Tax=Halobacillus salinarum TaxID=2932257 RepID=A0ABY4EKX7_9BACI|nr:SMR family transporter [Halobacillus salinarum]UOQ44207.1 SMR family transporter [Halobacillus salinarum]